MSKTLREIKTTPEYIYLTTLLTSYLLMQCLDNLKGTPYYKQQLKLKTNTLYRELEDVMKRDMPEIFGVQDENLYLLMDYVKEGIQDMAIVRPEEIGIRNEIMAMFRETPEKVLDALNIGLVDTLAEIKTPE